MQTTNLPSKTDNVVDMPRYISINVITLGVHELDSTRTSAYLGLSDSIIDVTTQRQCIDAMRHVITEAWPLIQTI